MGGETPIEEDGEDRDGGKYKPLPHDERSCSTGGDSDQPHQAEPEESHRTPLVLLIEHILVHDRERIQQSFWSTSKSISTGQWDWESPRIILLGLTTLVRAAIECRVKNEFCSERDSLTFLEHSTI